MAQTLPVILVQPEGLEIDAGDLTDFAHFRAWTRSDRFPERGRIDWLDGVVEVDMAPEDLFTHGTVKVAVAADLRARVEPRWVWCGWIGPAAWPPRSACRSSPTSYWC